MSTDTQKFVIAFWQGAVAMTALYIFGSAIYLRTKLSNTLIKLNLVQGALIFISQTILTVYLLVPGLNCLIRQFVGVLATELSNFVVMTLVGLECVILWKRSWKSIPIIIAGMLFLGVVITDIVYLTVSPVGFTAEGTCTVAYDRNLGMAFNGTKLAFYVFVYIITAYKLVSHARLFSNSPRIDSKSIISTSRSVIRGQVDQTTDPGNRLLFLLTCNHRFAVGITLVVCAQVVNTYITPLITQTYGGSIARTLSTLLCLVAHKFVKDVTKSKRTRGSSSSPGSTFGSSNPPPSNVEEMRKPVPLPLPQLQLQFVRIEQDQWLNLSPSDSAYKNEMVSHVNYRSMNQQRV
ncbi:hypothetical protein BKA69DRAFT_1087404 [Paraphysoderma sedebokerense]|nr:hypothetical protein BKA69DRAFT_1087404 [Paraphysoderma sedebokerense]